MLFFSPVHSLRGACFGIGCLIRVLFQSSSFFVPLLVLFLSLLCISFPHCGFSGFFLCSLSSSSFLFFCGGFSSSFHMASIRGFAASVVWITMGPCPPFCSPLLGVDRLCCPRSLYMLSSFSPTWVQLASVFAWGSVLGILLVVVAVRVFFAFIVFVSFFWFPSLSAGGECLGGVHSSFLVSILVVDDCFLCGLLCPGTRLVQLPPL